MKDGTLIGRFIKSVQNIQKQMSITAGLPEGQLVPIYLASDTLKSRSFRRGKMDMFHGFSTQFAEAMGALLFVCLFDIPNPLICARILTTEPLYSSSTSCFRHLHF